MIDIEDHGELLAYLRGTGRVTGSPAVRTLRGGVSNRVVRVGDWVIKQALEKLRVADDWYSEPERVEREALALRWLPRLTAPGSTPPLVFDDPAQRLLAMEAVPEPHRNWKEMLLDGVIKTDHVLQFGALLGTLHRAARGRQELADVFDDRTYFESLRLDPYYAVAASRVPAAAEFLHALIDDTRRERLTLVHGDYSPKNVLVHAGRLILVDHEVAHYGDPGFDIGFALTHLLSKGHHLATRRDGFATAAADFWSAYEQHGEVDGALSERAARHTIGCLLARVAGRSPLEYLDERERADQARAVLALMADPPSSPPEVIPAFLGALP